MMNRFACLAAILTCIWGAHAAADKVTDNFGEREMILYMPAKLAPVGQRVLIVALHGGGGNARFMQNHLKLDEVAEKYGFMVAYLNGTRAARLLPEEMRAWNAGDGCCGLPADAAVDDVTYIAQATDYIAKKYGMDPARTFVTGHSNGAMMAQLMICTTDVFPAAVTMSGPLNNATKTCPKAAGKRILAIHGINDQNVPIAGGQGTKGPMRAKQVNYRAEESAKQLFEQSGASYTIDAVPDVGHELARLNEAVMKYEATSIPEKMAVFFGLDR